MGKSAGASVEERSVDGAAARIVSDSCPPPFAALLRRYRLAAGLTQEELAHHARLSARAISALERGVNRRPHLETTSLLAEALCLSAEEQAGFMTARRRAPRRGACLPGPEPSARENLHARPLVNRTEEMLVIQEHIHTGTPGSLHDTVPWTIAEGVRHRVSDLSVEAQELLRVAAVAGRVVSRALLLMIGTGSAAQGAIALEELCRTGLLMEEGENAYRFTHDVIREVVESDLGAARRALMHQQIAETLEHRPDHSPSGRAAEFSWRFLQGGDDKRARHYAALAGDEAMRAGALADAEEQYAIAADLMRTANERGEAEGQEKLGTVRSLRSRYREALQALERSAELYRDLGDVEGVARTVARIGWTHSRGGTSPEGLNRVQLALDSVEIFHQQVPPRGLAQLYLALSTLLFDVGRYEEELAAAEQAAATALRAGDDHLLARANERRGLALATLRRHEEAILALEGAVPAFESAGDMEWLWLALRNLSWAYYDGRGDIETALDYAERSVEAAERAGNPLDTMNGLDSLYHLTLRIGDWSESRRWLERAVEASRRLGAPHIATFPLCELARVCLAEGKWDEAIAYIHQARELAERIGHFDALTVVEHVQADQEVARGRADSAVARLERLVNHPALKESHILRLQASLASAYLEIGMVGRAEDLATECVRRGTAVLHRTMLAVVLPIQAKALSRQGKWHAARCALEAGLEMARFIRFTYAEARALQIYGRMCVDRGDPNMGRQQLQAALEIFRKVGAGPDVEGTERALAEIESRLQAL